MVNIVLSKGLYCSLLSFHCNLISSVALTTISLNMTTVRGIPYLNIFATPIKYLNTFRNVTNALAIYTMSLCGLLKHNF